MASTAAIAYGMKMSARKSEVESLVKSKSRRGKKDKEKPGEEDEGGKPKDLGWKATVVTGSLTTIGLNVLSYSVFGTVVQLAAMSVASVLAATVATTEIAMEDINGKCFASMNLYGMETHISDVLFNLKVSEMYRTNCVVMSTG